MATFTYRAISIGPIAVHYERIADRQASGRTLCGLRIPFASHRSGAPSCSECLRIREAQDHEGRGNIARACGCVITGDRSQMVARCPVAVALWAPVWELVGDPAMPRIAKGRTVNMARAHAGLAPVDPDGFTGPR
jgi:hypothetical protein